MKKNSGANYPMMKVVALKIWQKQDALLRALVKAGLYSSLSEGLRTAAWDLLKTTLKPYEEGNNVIKKVNVPKEFEKQFHGPTVSISAKFPLSMITVIDHVVTQIEEYANRSDFFRVALIGFLITDSQLFSPYILEK